MSPLWSILLWVAFCGCLTQGREEINFDFGWRFHLGDIPSYVNCNGTAFPHNLSNVECLGLKSNPVANTANECLDSCCGDQTCGIWQYAMDKGCWIGTSNDCNHKNNDWVGGGRDLPVPPAPPSKTGPTSRGYDDSSWTLVDVPHDGIITGVYSETVGPEKQAYLPKNVTIYRKHFNLPKEWTGQSIWVYFEGVFRASTVFLNGQQLMFHDSGYTSFPVRLDTATNVYYGDGKENENVLVVKASPSGESGWWYEGCGIYRHVKLIAANQVYLLPDSVYGASNVTGKITRGTSITKGQVSEDATFYFQSDVINSVTPVQDVNIIVSYTLYDEDNKMKTSVNSSLVKIESGKNSTLRAQVKVNDVELWSNLRPYLYTLSTSVIMSGTEMIMDSTNVSIGVRHTKWDADTGFYLNNQQFVWRGFNNHNNFAGVGMAVPDRVNLFRGQSMRAVGANAWRMSHNPPIPVMLDILDRLGIIVWDENREFGDNDIWLMNQRDMVKRDRNHPSIMTWSFCNEAGCDSADKATAERFRDATYQEDSFRPVAANMNGKIGADLSQVIDIQGFSHRPGTVFDNYHKQYPNKPLIGSECCSCRTQRGEYVTDADKKIFGNFNADCNQEQTNYELTRPFVAGCMVWTLFDYYGEPTPYGWPHVSSSFGSIDLAGFAKASAYWYRTYWLYEKQLKKATDVTYNPPSLVNPAMKPSEDNSSNDYFIYIVQQWDEIEKADTRTVQVYTNGNSVKLYVNGKLQSTLPATTEYVEFDNVKYESGNITAVAYDSSSGNVQASQSKLTAGTATKITAGVDVPSASTGTGSALVLDGQDTGMVHAAIRDSNGNLVNMASNNITFKIVSGPGRIIGVGNGNPACHEPNQATWRSAYHGLARAIIQVTMDQASPQLHRKRLMQIDRDGGVRTTIVAPGYEQQPLEDIVVEVSAEGLGSAQVTIPVSTNADRDGVLSVAGRWNSPS